MRTVNKVMQRVAAGPQEQMRTALALGLGAILAALVWLSGPAQAAAMTPADFVQTRVNEGVAILGDETLGTPTRREKFRSYILSLVDERRIALFTLGRYRRGADEAVVEEFVKAFTDYAVAVYEARLGEYTDQTLKVVDTLERSPTDIVVTTVLQGNGAAAGEPINVAFRLSKDGETYSVIDVQVVGIWLAIDQQSQFSAFLSKNNGDIKKLIADLNRRAADIRAGKATQ